MSGNVRFGPEAPLIEEKRRERKRSTGCGARGCDVKKRRTCRRMCVWFW
jgi:hypothetical protein